MIECSTTATVLQQNMARFSVKFKSILQSIHFFKEKDKAHRKKHTHLQQQQCVEYCNKGKLVQLMNGNQLQECSIKVLACFQISTSMDWVYMEHLILCNNRLQHFTYATYDSNILVHRYTTAVKKSPVVQIISTALQSQATYTVHAA